MSNSVRHTPIHSWTNAPSDKAGKQQANRALRKINKNVLSQLKQRDLTSVIDTEDLQIDMHNIKEVSSVWQFPKDGKSYLKPEMIEKCPKLMRK